MSIPADPVSKHNPVLSVKWLRCVGFSGSSEELNKEIE